MTQITFAEIAKLPVLPQSIRDGDSPGNLIIEINRRIEAAGVEFGESSFRCLHTLPVTKSLEEYRWITAEAVQGGNEGYYIHLTAVPQRHDKDPSILFATAKTWDWESALAIAAVATRILSWH